MAQAATTRPASPISSAFSSAKSANTASAAHTEPIAILETVIDDSSPQLLGYVSELLLAAGAWDVYRATVQMKKGRTGVQLTVLCRPDLVPALRDLIFRETTTIGLHWRIENKSSLARDFQSVNTPWGPVRIKIARWPSGLVANASPEYEDCRRLAAEHSVPLKQVMQDGDEPLSRSHSTPRTATRSQELMDPLRLESLLNEVRDGRTPVNDALDRLKTFPLKTSASPSSTIIAPSAPACPR